MILSGRDNRCAPDSVMNSLTPGSKLGLLLLIFTSALISGPFTEIPLLLLYLLVLYRMAGLSPLKWLKRLIPLLPLILLVTLFQTMFRIPGDSSQIFWSWKFLEFSQADIPLFLRFSTRFVVIIGLFFLFTSLLSINQISHGVEESLRPLGKLGFPVYEAGLIVTITFRFIPLLQEELEKITLAQKARGAFQNKKGFRGSVLGRLPLLIPLFVTALHRAEFLAVAMEARGYVVGKKRTRLVHHRKSLSDVLLLLSAWLILALILLMKSFHIDQKTGVYIYEQFIG